MELFLLVDTLKRSGAKTVVAVVPYFGYSRQHRTFRQNECMSADMILKILAVLGVDKVITVDFHNVENIQHSPLPLKNISALPLLANVMAKKIDTSNAVVVSPDAGGAARAQIFADHFFRTKGVPICVMQKKRDLHTAHRIRHSKIINTVAMKNKTAIIVDDICTTGKTLLSAVDICMREGAKQVHAAVTHPDMDRSVVALIKKSPIELFYTTNTIESFSDLVDGSKKFVIVNSATTLKNLCHTT